MSSDNGQRQNASVRRVRSHVPDFALLLLLAVAWNGVLLFDRETIVGHDTFHNYSLFHIFHSHLVEHGALPLWLPYCSKGFSSLLWEITYLSPSNVGFIGLGRILGIADTSVLHKLSLFHEVLAYLAGVYLYSTRLFTDRRTRFLVCVLALGTVSWHDQVYFCLRMVYLLPLILWFLLRFFDTGRPVWLWAAACGTLVECLGGPPYFAGPQLLSLAAFAVPLIVAKPRTLRRILEPSLSNALGALLFVGLFLAVDRAADYAMSDVTVIRAERGEDGRTNLNVFLRFGELDWRLASSYLPGHYHRKLREPNLYAGAAAIVLCAAAWGARRQVEVWCVVLPVLAMFAFAFSDLFATAAYRLPLMGYYRHRAYVLSIATFFLVLWSGWGFEALFRAEPVRQARYLAAGVVGIVVCTLLRSALVLAAPAWTRHAEYSPARSAVTVLAVAASSAILFLSRRAPGTRGLAAMVFGTALVLQTADLSLYQWKLQSTIRRRDPAQAALFKTRPERYVPERRNSNLRPVHHGVSYALEYQFQGVDPCRAVAWREATDPDVREIMTDKSLDKSARDVVTGCGHPKLVFTNAVQVVASVRHDDVIGLLDEHGGRLFVVEGDDRFRDFVPGTDFLAPLPSEFTLNRLRCGFEAPRDGFLFYSDSFHPDWRASLDGEPVEILVGNSAFKAVFVPAGRHEVVFEFGGTSAFHAGTMCVVGLVSFVFVSVPLVVCAVRPLSMPGTESPSGKDAPTREAERSANGPGAEGEEPRNAEPLQSPPTRAVRGAHSNPAVLPAE